MVYLIVESWFPASETPATGKKYLEVTEKFPPDRSISKEVAIVFNSVPEGIHGISISKIWKGKTDESLKRATETMLLYSEIKGYKYKINTYLSIEECLPMIGLELPVAAPAV